MVGLRLDKALSFIDLIGTRSRAEFLIDEGCVRVNQRFAKSSYHLKSTDTLEISIPEPQPMEIMPYDLKLDILFEDEDIIVVNKPSGLVVHPGAGHPQDTLVNALVAYTKNLAMKFGEDRPGIVHRLDRETSGILVVAKNDFSQENLSQQFRLRTVHRIYYAITLGIPPKPEGIIRSFLARHPLDRKRYASVLGDDNRIIRTAEPAPSLGKWAVTHYKVLQTHPSGVSYLQLKLETGRTHQIRVHLSEMGCPILADETYGAQKKLKSIHGHPNQDLVKTATRCALHAAELGFEHPRSRVPLEFKVDWPDFQEIRTHFVPGLSS